MFTEEEVSNFQPILSNLLVKLPPVPVNGFEHSSGLFIATTLSDQYQYHPVFGEVISKGDSCTCEVGDKVFFHYLTYTNALNAEDALLFDTEKNKYMIFGEQKIIFAKRGEDVVAFNEHVILKKIEKKVDKTTVTPQFNYSKSFSLNTSTTAGGIIFQDEEFEKDKAEVVAACEGVNFTKGDIVAVVQHWDVQAENALMETLGFPLYYLNQEYAFKIIKVDDKLELVP